MIEIPKNKAREYERSLWSISSDEKDNAAWIEKLEDRNRRIDLLKKRLFSMTNLDENYQPIEGIDNFIFMLSLDSATRQILELEQEIAFLKDIEKDMKDGVMTDEDTSDDSFQDKADTKSETKRLLKTLHTKLNSTINQSPPLEYLSNVLFMQNRKINRLLEIKDVFTSINDMSDEQDLLKSLKILSKKINKYVSTLQLQMFYASINSSPSSYPNRELLDVHKQLEVFEDTFPEYCNKIPCARILDKGKCRIAELENQYIQLTEKPRILTQNHIAILEKNLATRKTEIETTRRRYEKSINKRFNESVILLSKEKTSTTKKKANKKTKEQARAEIDDMSDEEEVRYFDKTYKEKIRMYEDMKNTKCKSKERLQKQRCETWQMKCENIQLRDENLQLERKVKMNENMLDELMLSKDIDEMISRQAKMSAKITSEKQDNFELNKDKFLSDKQLLYNCIDWAYGVQMAIRGGNRYHDYLLKRYESVKDVLLKKQEKKNSSTNPIHCGSCKLFDEKLKHATNVISTISAQMVKIRELFHMPPFKKFLKTILQYMMTKKKVEPKRRKLRFERETRGKQAKREKRVKQTNERPEPTETSEKKPAKKQKTLNLSSDEYIDSLVARINGIVLTKDDYLSYKNTTTEQEHEPKRNIIEENLSDEDDVFKTALEIAETMRSFTIEDEMIHKLDDFYINWHNISS